MNKHEIRKLLNIILKFLDNLDDAQLQSLLDGKTKLNIEGGVSGAKGKLRAAKPVSDGVKPTYEMLDTFSNRLREAATREEAAAILDGLNRDLLAKVARSLGVFIKKDDKRDTVQNKIIESTVGSKLRSDAILGLEFKHK